MLGRMTNSTPQGPESIHTGPFDQEDAEDDAAAALDDSPVDLDDPAGPELTADVDDVDAGSARDR